MCGRFALFSDADTLARRFQAPPPPDWFPRYNIAPSQPILIVRAEHAERRFAAVRWGLIPHWAKDIKTGYSTINARAETVAQKPAFREAFSHRRCLVPADGFYEWQARAGAKIKQPWFVCLKDRLPMALAGLWERWQSPEGDLVESATIIVTRANALMQPIHERMPVILPAGDWDRWLDPTLSDRPTLETMLRPYPAGDLTAWPVTTLVNNPRNDSPECITPIDPTP